MGFIIIQEIREPLCIPPLDSNPLFKQVSVLHGQLSVIATFFSSYPISRDNLSTRLIRNSQVNVFQRQLCRTLVLWDIHSYREKVSSSDILKYTRVIRIQQPSLVPGTARSYLGS